MIFSKIQDPHPTNIHKVNRKIFWYTKISLNRYIEQILFYLTQVFKNRSSNYVYLFSTPLHSKDRNFFHEEKDAPRRSRVKIGSQSGNSSWPGYKSLSRKAPRARRKLEHKEYWPTYRDPSLLVDELIRTVSRLVARHIGSVVSHARSTAKRGGSSSSSIVESFSRIEWQRETS